MASGVAAHDVCMTRLDGPRVLLVAASLMVTAGCGGSGGSAGSGGSGGGGGSAGSVQAATPSSPEPGEFVAAVTNEWMPWIPGTRWVFVGRTADGAERTVVTVTDRTKVVGGVTTVVVHDVVHRNGALLEVTDDWYAQDRKGNVWYFGEDTKEYDGTKVDTGGSWEAGVDGAEAGIAMLAEPLPGDAYRQEFYRGEAEDEAEVLAVDASASVPYGDLSHLLETKDFTRLEPSAAEHKYYAKGVGVVLEVSLEEQDRTELVSMTTRD